MRVRPSLLAIAGLIGGIAACFDGLGVVGAICYADNQCGTDQRCVNSVCGLCRNQVVDTGELCFGDSSEENVFGEITELIAYDPENDGFGPLLIATVNTNCLPPPNSGPPAPDDPACWQAFAMSVDPIDGDFETTNVLEDKYGDGRVPQATTGNFDGESTMDIAVAIVPSDKLIDQSQLVVAHNLAGSGQPSVDLELDFSLRAQSLHAADLDGDGLDDLMVGGEITSSLVVFISTPGVGFQNERLLVIADPAPRPAPPVDVDNDGDLDVVLVSPVDRTLSVYLNNGNGYLAVARREVVSPTLTPWQLATADFDRDGNVDVVVFVIAQPGVEGEVSEIQVYRGSGDGQLELDQTLPGGELPVSGLATDVNADGWPDIVIADVLEDKLPVHINRNGQFPDFVSIDVAASPLQLVYGDFDWDDVPDLAIGSANGVISVVPSEN